MSCQLHLKHPHNDRLPSDAQQGSPHAGCDALRETSPLPSASGTRLRVWNAVPARCKIIKLTLRFTPKTS